ncbi:MAG: T9SS type A sorting domain-containing protein [Crocinitomicaceae bacterium]|nr:T9SS type A sorting domain-containing protein [Crocinitomicaceae bacterium]
MKLKLLLSVFTLLLLGTTDLNAQSTFYGVSPFGSNLEVMDSTTMTSTASIPMTSSTGAVSGGNGLAADPCGVLYIVYKAAGSRYLGTIDPATGVITEIGDLGDNVANIAFVNGALLAVTGDGASTSETLFSVNILTGAMTLVTALGNGADGEAIQFNPDDGQLYHWSGWGTTSVIMESINPVTFAITPITLSGATLANVGSAAYVGNGNFLISDINTNGIKYITTGGFVTATSNTTFQFKGMAFGGGSASVTNTTAANDSICAGDTAILVCNDIGGTYEWFLDGLSTGNTTSTLNATVTGAYVCEFDNGACTLVSDTINLTVSNLPTTNITPSPSATICPGDSIELTLNTGGGPAAFQWYLDGAAISGATNSSYFASTAGSYNAMKTNQNGCSDSSAVATVITVSSLPNVNITPSPVASICDGDSIELVTPSGGGTPQWALNGTDIAGATGTSYFATAAGTYTVSKTNMSGCSATTATGTDVTVNPLPPVSLSPSGTVNFCAGDSVEITITQGAGGGTFQWFMDGTAVSGATNPTYFATAEGSYNLEKTNMNGCSDSSTVATVLVDTCNNNLFELNGLSFDIYPNPASEFVSIDFNSFTNTYITGLQLVGLDGKIVRVFNISEANANGMSIDVSDVNTGIYFVRLTTAYGQIVKEIVIE